MLINWYSKFCEWYHRVSASVGERTMEEYNWSRNFSYFMIGGNQRNVSVNQNTLVRGGGGNNSNCGGYNNINCGNYNDNHFENSNCEDHNISNHGNRNNSRNVSYDDHNCFPDWDSNNSLNFEESMRWKEDHAKIYYLQWCWLLTS